MALFKNTDELKTFLPKIVGDVLDHVLTFVDDATEQFIRKYLGDEQYDALQEAYTANDMTDAQRALLPYVQKPLARFAMLYYFDQGQTLKTKSGIRIVITDEMKTAFKWQIEDEKESYRELGYQSIEALIKFLDKNIEDYTTYAESVAFENNREHFINYASDYQNFYDIDSSRNIFETMRPQMRFVENNWVKETLGKEYYDELKEKIVDDDLVADDEAIMSDLKSGIAHFTIARAIITNAVKIDHNGVMVRQRLGDTRDTNINRNPATELQKSPAYLDALDQGNKMLKKVSDFLNANASDSKYTTYKSSSTYADPATTASNMFDNTAPTSKIFIG